MKPDWKDAPEWANYLAMDENGTWNWHCQKPRPLREMLTINYWHSKPESEGIFPLVHPAKVAGWDGTLEARPEK